MSGREAIRGRPTARPAERVRALRRSLPRLADGIRDDTAVTVASGSSGPGRLGHRRRCAAAGADRLGAAPAHARVRGAPGRESSTALALSSRVRGDLLLHRLGERRRQRCRGRQYRGIAVGPPYLGLVLAGVLAAAALVRYAAEARSHPARPADDSARGSLIGRRPGRARPAQRGRYGVSGQWPGDRRAKQPQSRAGRLRLPRSASSVSPAPAQSGHRSSPRDLRTAADHLVVGETFVPGRHPETPSRPGDSSNPSSGRSERWSRKPNSGTRCRRWESNPLPREPV